MLDDKQWLEISHLEGIYSPALYTGPVAFENIDKDYQFIIDHLMKERARVFVIFADSHFVAIRLTVIEEKAESGAPALVMDVYETSYYSAPHVRRLTDFLTTYLYPGCKIYN